MKNNVRLSGCINSGIRDIKRNRGELISWEGWDGWVHRVPPFDILIMSCHVISSCTTLRYNKELTVSSQLREEDISRGPR